MIVGVVFVIVIVFVIVFDIVLGAIAIATTGTSAM